MAEWPVHFRPHCPCPERESPVLSNGKTLGHGMRSDCGRLSRLKLVDEESAAAARELLVRIVAMLIRMVLTLDESGTGAGT